MRRRSAQGAEVIRATADPLSVEVEGRRETGAQLGKGGAVNSGEFPFLLRDRRIRGCKDPVRGPGGDIGGNGGCMEGFKGAFVGVGGEDTVGKVGGYCGEEFGLEGVFFVSSRPRRREDCRVGRVGGNEAAGKELRR